MSFASRSALTIVAGNAHPQLAAQLARELGVPLISADVGAFADGETRVHVGDDVRGADVFVVQPICTPVNENLMVLALLVDAIRACGAHRICGIVPYLGYARQEQRGRPGDPRSAQVVGRLLGAVGLDELVTLDLHAEALESALPMPATLLRADSLFLTRIKSWNVSDLVVVSPDAGGMKRAQRYAQALGVPLAAMAKRRTRPDAVAAVQVLGDVAGRTCVVVDDMASTGHTMTACAEALRQAGAREIHAVFTHAVMAPGAKEQLMAARFGRIVTSDTVPISAGQWLEVVPVAPLLAQAIRALRGDVAGCVARDGVLSELRPKA